MTVDEALARYQALLERNGRCAGLDAELDAARAALDAARAAEVAVVAMIGTEGLHFQAYVRDPDGTGDHFSEQITPDGARWRALGMGTHQHQDEPAARQLERERAHHAIVAAFPEASAAVFRTIARLSIPLPDELRTAYHVALWAALSDAQLAAVCEAIATHIDEAPRVNLLRAVRDAGDAARETLARYDAPRFVQVS